MNAVISTAGIAQRLLDALYAGGPVPAGCRVNHARGLLVQGRFRPTDDARLFSRAGIFAASKLPAVVRFSNSSGDAAIPQDDPRGNPNGVAVEIDRQLVLVGHAVEVFPASTPKEFLAFLGTLGAKREGTAPSQALVCEFPAAARFEAMRSAAPTSFATQRYHMLHTYRLERPDGTAVDGRLSILGDASEGAGGLNTSTGADHLDHELTHRLGRGPVRLSLAFQPVATADRTDDIASPWAAATQTVTLGHLELDGPAADQNAQSTLVFDPGRLPDGIAFAGDPMIGVRLEAYRLAARRRLDGLSPPAQGAS